MSKSELWTKSTILKKARDAVRGLRIELETGEPWLGGDDMVSVQRIWERQELEEYVKHLRELEDKLSGFLRLYQ